MVVLQEFSDKKWFFILAILVQTDSRSSSSYSTIKICPTSRLP
jgi:hypothetical protein